MSTDTRYIERLTEYDLSQRTSEELAKKIVAMTRDMVLPLQRENERFRKALEKIVSIHAVTHEGIGQFTPTCSACIAKEALG